MSRGKPKNIVLRTNNCPTKNECAVCKVVDRIDTPLAACLEGTDRWVCLACFAKHLDLPGADRLIDYLNCALLHPRATPDETFEGFLCNFNSAQAGPDEQPPLGGGLNESSTRTSGNYFGDCPQCFMSDGLLNVGRNHYGVCDEHRTYWGIGSNLFSGWRNETEEEWERNRQKLSRFTLVEPVRLVASVMSQSRGLTRVGAYTDSDSDVCNAADPPVQLTVDQTRASHEILALARKALNELERDLCRPPQAALPLDRGEAPPDDIHF